MSATTWRQGLSLTCPDSEGRGRLPVLNLGRASANGGEIDRMPAWDDREVLFPVASSSPRFTGLLLVGQSDLRAAAAKEMPPASTEQIVARRGQSSPTNDLSRELPMFSVPVRWQVEFPYGSQAVACALARNAALVALRQREGSRLCAYDPSDGKELWSIALPGVPLHDGLAVAADGSVVVTQVEGRTIRVAGQRQ